MTGLIELLRFEELNINRQNERILSNINFSLYNAEVTFILGPSGSGKSSFLKSIYGVMEIEGKSAKILGQDLLNIKKNELQLLRRKLGLVFQDFRIFEKLSVYDNLNYFLQSINFKDAEYRKQSITKILDKVELANQSTKKGFELSGGEKQRLAIARALVHKPKLVIADEPTGNLNKQLGIEIFKLLRELALEDGSSIITATHDESLAQLFSTKMYVCKNKELVKI